MELDGNGNFCHNMPAMKRLFAGMATQLFSDVINLSEAFEQGQALLKSEAEEKRASMWAERLSLERNKVVDEVAREEKVPPAEYESPPKTEAEAIFRILDVNRQGFVTTKVTLDSLL